MIKNVCVYASSSSLVDHVYVKAAAELGRALAQRGWGLVFGAGADGLMGAAAAGAAEVGGVTIGVVPEKMDVTAWLGPKRHRVLCECTLRERKALMEDKADAFIAAGRFRHVESCRRSCAAVLDIIKAGGILNVNGYYDG